MIKVRVRKTVRKGRYVERRITLPFDFPDCEYVYVLTEEELSNISPKSSNTISPKCNHFPEMVQKLLEIYERGDICRARKTDKSYIVECSDGRKAVIPESFLEEFAYRFQNIIIVEGGR